MAEIYTKPDTKKKFTTRDSPFDSRDVLESDPAEDLNRGPTSEPWGWFPFLYESPFTAERVPVGLIGLDFGQWGDFPSLDNLSFGIASGDPDLGGSSPGLTSAEVIDSVTGQLCDPEDTDKYENPDKLTACQSILSPCDFSKYVGALNLLIATSAGDLTPDFSEGTQYILNNTEVFEISLCGFTYSLSFETNAFTCDGDPGTTAVLSKVNNSTGAVSTVRTITNCLSACGAEACFLNTVAMFEHPSLGMTDALKDEIESDCDTAGIDCVLDNIDCSGAACTFTG